MLIILAKDSIYHLSLEQRMALHTALKLFTRSLVVKSRVEDLQLGVKSYQQKLNIKAPDTVRDYLKNKEAFDVHLKPDGFIYRDSKRHHRLMRMDQLEHFRDATLNHVCSALLDIRAGIKNNRLPPQTSIWDTKSRQMIDAIDRQMRRRRILRKLEMFVSARPMTEDRRTLKRTA